MFASNDDFEKAIEEATDKSSIESAIGNENSNKWLSDTDLTDNLVVADPNVSGKVLNTDYSQAPVSFPSLVAATYGLTMQAPAPQPIPQNDTKKVTRTIKYDVSGTNHAAINSVTQTITYTRTGSEDPTTHDITWGSWTSTTTVFPSTDVQQIKGFDSYVDGVKSTTVNAVPVNFVNGDPQNGQTVTVTYRKQGDLPVKYDPSRDDMAVTRTIRYDVNGTGHQAIDPATQTVTYTREDAQGNAGYQDPVTGKISWNTWRVKGNKAATFPSTAVQQIPGFSSYIDGTESTTVNAAPITEINGVPQNGQTVVVTYQKSDRPNHNNGGQNNHQTPADNHGNGQHNVISLNQSNTKSAKNTVGQRARKLPQTGNKHSSAIAGLGVASLMAMLGLVSVKKRDWLLVPFKICIKRQIL